MKTLSFFILSHCSLLFIFAPSLAAEQLLDRVLASIEGEPITLSEVQRFSAGQGRVLRQGEESENDIRTALQEVVAQRLLEKEAEALSISVSQEEIETYLDEIQRQNGLDREGFKELLSQRGIDWASYLKQVQTEILKSRVVSARVRAKVNVVDEDIERFLSEQPELKPEVGAKRVLQLALGSELERAAEVRATLVEKMESAATAETSQSETAVVLDYGAQDLGYVKTDELRSEIKEALESLPDGELSSPVLVGESYVVFYIAGSISENSPVDDLLKAEITSRVYEKKFQEQLRQFLEVELPKRYHVERL